MTIQAFERNSVARILAEPTVTAVSGEIAKVMVGGEIAVPGPGSCVATNGSNICTPSVVFKPYGVSLAFTPVVQAEGRILIHVGITAVRLSPTDRRNLDYGPISCARFCLVSI
jgi:pilus assembly protein CpaC